MISKPQTSERESPRKAQPSHRILLVGCGQLGARHLQAVSLLDSVAEVEVVDTRPGALESGRKQLEEVEERRKRIEYKWHDDLERAGEPGDLCVVATGAAGRCELVKSIAAKLGYRRFIIEKLAAQSVAEYEDLLAYAGAHGLSIWVNCQERTFPLHRQIKEKIKNEPIVVAEVAGNRGLATVGIHGIDNFVFYTGSKELTSAGSSLDDILHTTKRGFYDLSGTIQALGAGGSRLVLCYAKEGIVGKHVIINARDRRWMITQANKEVWEGCADNDWKWEKMPFEGELRVSRSTTAFAKSILESERCDLPTLEQAFPAHRFLLTEMLPQFNKLLRKQDDLCPVT